MIEFKKGKQVLYLSTRDVKDANLSMREIIDVLEDVFVEKDNDRFQMPPKVGIHTKQDAFIYAMPCWVPKYNSCGLKWVSGYPDNTQLGYQYITGLLILNCVETGIPLSIMDCKWITAMRTGAVSGVAAKYFSRPDSEILGILGCGVQGRTNLEAILITCPNIRRVFAFDIAPENTRKFVKEMSSKFSLEIIPATRQKEAVVNSDIVITAGALVENRVIEVEWFKEGALACLVDFDVMWKPETLQIVDKYYVDDVAQYKYFKDKGFFKDVPGMPSELDMLINRKTKGRGTYKERIIFLNIGLALEDIAVAHKIYDKALKNDIGVILPL